MDIIDKLLAACVWYPVTNIPWPHRVLHDAAEEITRLRAELADARAQILSLRAMLRSYAEREKTMGWSTGEGK